MINLDKIIDKLMRFGFTKTESLTYVHFLKNGVSSGYKIAKELNLSRSTVYQAIDSLYNKGYLFLVPSENKEYQAKDIEVMMQELETEYLENTEYLKRELNSFKELEETKYFYNLEGDNNIISKAKEMISNSKQDIYMSLDLDLKPLIKELENAITRNVKVTIFSFQKQNTYGLDIEVYSRYSKDGFNPVGERLMLVCDRKNVLVAFNESKYNLVGNFSNNPIYATIIAEHIHHDIYLSKIYKNNPDFIENDIWINSKHEEESKRKMILLNEERRNIG